MFKIKTFAFFLGLLYNVCGDIMAKNEKKVKNVVGSKIEKKTAADIKEDVEKIKEVIDKIRPFLITDGGNIEFVSYKDGKVYVKMLGACAGCELIDYTLKDGVESAIKEVVPTIKEVINITSDIID